MKTIRSKVCSLEMRTVRADDVFDDIAVSLVLGLHQSSKETLGILKGLNLS